MVTLRPRASRMAPREAEAMPFPNEETTPPVTNTNWVIWNSRCGAGTALRNREDRLSEAGGFQKCDVSQTRIPAEKHGLISVAAGARAIRCANPVRWGAPRAVRRRRVPPPPGARARPAPGASDPGARAPHAAPAAIS